MSVNKTQPSKVSVQEFLAQVAPATRREDALALDRLFRKVTGFTPVMWGASIIGYGAYHFRYASGREGDHLATGFSPRARAFSIYIMPGYQDFSGLLNRLGPHKHGKSCLYFTRLSDVDQEVLATLIGEGLAGLNAIWPVRATP